MAITRPVSQAISSRVRPRNNIVGLIGHSIQAQALPVTALPSRTVYLSATAMPFWLSFLSKGRYQFRQDCSFGVPGSSIKDIYTQIISGSDTQLSAAIKSPASTIYIHTFHNDAFASASWRKGAYGEGDDGKGMNYILGQLTAAGKTVVLSSEIPGGDAAHTSFRPTASQLAALQGYRDWAVRQAPNLYPGMVYGIDYWPVIADPAAATAGDALANCLKDGTHPGSLGAYLMAQQALPVFDRLGIPQSFPPIGQPGDYYDATNNQRGNLLTNGILTAVNAMPANSGTTTYVGVRPAGWAFNLNAAALAATLTITGSQVTNARGRWYQLAVSGTTTGSAGPKIQLQQTNIVLPSVGGSFLSAGDILEIAAEMEIDATGTGLYGSDFMLQRVEPGVADTIILGESVSALGKLDFVLANLASAPLAGTLSANGINMTITGAETSFTPNLELPLFESSSVNFTVRWRNAALKKVTAS